MAGRLRTRIPLSVALIPALLGCTSCVYVGGDWGTIERYEKEVSLSASLAAGSSLSAGTGDGSITLEGAETSECRIQATIVAHARTVERAEELGEQIDVRLESAGQGLRVVIDRPHVIRNAWFAVSLKGEIPRQTDLTLATSDGSIHLANIAGRVEARTSDGRIDLRDVEGDVQLKTSDGGIAGTRLTTQTLACRTSDGGIHLSDATASSFVAETSDGSITLEGVRVDTARIHTTDGAIHWRQAVATRADCHSSDGAIRIEYSSAAPKALRVSATTSDGSITLVTPPELSATIKAGTSDGSIHTERPITIRGRVGKSLNGIIGDGEGGIHLRTSDGSITIR